MIRLKYTNVDKFKLYLFGFISVIFFFNAAAKASSLDPLTTQTFQQAISSFSKIQSYDFGTDPSLGKNVTNISQLSQSFAPYGIAGTTVINQEWERYQTFNTTNFVFTPQSLNLTATIPSNGGLFAGGIYSGQIWSNATYQPGATGYNVYAFEVRMKIPNAQGSWPAAWFYSKQPWPLPLKTDASEIDNPEFMVMNTQNQLDWTGYNHGPGVGQQIYSIKTNQYVWQPNVIDFSYDYHNYQTIWTPDAVYKYVDGLLIYAQSYQWTSQIGAQIGINLAVGSNAAGTAGLQPTSLSEFPMTLAVDHLYIWAH